MTIREGLITAKHYGVSSIIVEIDNLIVINLLNSNWPLVDEIGIILNDITSINFW